MPSLGTWWRTIRHLRGEQIVGRLRFRLSRPVPDLRPPPPLRRPVENWVPPAARAPSFRAPDTFTFLNETHELGEVGWDNPTVAKLWRYNLHYFDDLAALGAAKRWPGHALLIGRWIAENPPGRGTGWEPYPTSLRIINWIRWLLAGASPATGMLESLATQSRWVSRRLEWHLLGNHLFINAKALMLAGLFFDGEEAAGWRATAIGIFARELPEQILADGGQFERSPMYHALALEDVLDLINGLIAFGTRDEREAALLDRLRLFAPRMLFWLRCMTFPSGGVTHFNDAADGVAPPMSEIERYAADLGIKAEHPPTASTIHLAESGYVRAAAGPAVIWADVAPVGPRYLPGHAHADTLSFELALDGRPLIVNGGTSCYGVGARREAERGTASHNTVQMESINSSEVWSSFRVGRRATPFDVQVSDATISAAHDGYSSLPGSPTHRRAWRLTLDSLIVEDDVEPNPVAAVARYRLAPGLMPRPTEAGWLIERNRTPIAKVSVEVGMPTWVPSDHAPEFGLTVATTTLVVALDRGRAVTRWSWLV